MITNLVMTIRLSLLSGLPKFDEYPEFISKCMTALSVSFDTKHSLDDGVHNFNMEVKVSVVIDSECLNFI